MSGVWCNVSPAVRWRRPTRKVFCAHMMRSTSRNEGGTQEVRSFRCNQQCQTTLQLTSDSMRAKRFSIGAFSTES
eukprot:2092164-Pleurochrysis_carterae.AAC.1